MCGFQELRDLARELENERQTKLNVEKSVCEIEQVVGKLEAYLRTMDSVGDDGEWQLQYQYQSSLNNHLHDEKSWLMRELEDVKLKNYYGQYPDAMNQSLETIPEFDLIRLVEDMERLKYESTASLKEIRNKIDEAQTRSRALAATKRALKTGQQETLERRIEENLVDRQTRRVRPISYSPSYLEYRENQFMTIDRAAYNELRSRQLDQVYQQ